MAYHPRDRWPWNKDLSRRDLLRYTAGGVVMAHFLAACGGDSSSNGSSSSGGIVIGTPENPVEQPLFDDNPAIESGLEPESGPLRVYNWADYIWTSVIKDFEKEFGVEVEVTTFYNLEEATRKLRTGEVNFDVFFPTAEIIPKFVAGLYDDYRETIAVGMFHNDSTDVNAADPEVLGAARDSLIELIDLVNIRYTIDGAYAKIPEGKFSVHHAWSGDMIGAQYYFPKGGDPNTLRFAWPPKTSDAGGYISNDSMGVLKGAENPVLAHEFLNFMLNEKWSMKNFSWLGYQPPLKNIEPSTLVSDGLVPAPLENALIVEGDYEFGQSPVQLTPAEDRAWLDAWSSIQSGG